LYKIKILTKSRLIKGYKSIWACVGISNTMSGKDTIHFCRYTIFLKCSIYIVEYLDKYSQVNLRRPLTFLLWNSWKFLEKEASLFNLGMAKAVAMVFEASALLHVSGLVSVVGMHQPLVLGSTPLPVPLK
jgi:hypothetical protein